MTTWTAGWAKVQATASWGRHHVVGLTDAGKTLQEESRAVLERFDQAIERTKGAGQGRVGRLCIGYVAEVTADVLPLSLKRHRAVYPDVDTELCQGTTGQLLDHLRQSRVDVAFVRTPGVTEDLEYEQLVVEALFAALPSDHCPTASAASFDEVVDQPFVVPSYEGARGLRRDIDDACAAAGFTPTLCREAPTLTAVLLLVAAGAGMALIPASVAHSYPVPGVKFIELEDAPCTSAGMARRRRESSEVIAKFLETTREVVTLRQHEPDVWPERHIDDGLLSDDHGG